MKHKTLKLLAIGLTMALLYVPAHAASVRLKWSAVSDAEGYRIYYGTAHDDLTEVVDVKNPCPTLSTCQYEVTGLTYGTVYFFRAKAYEGDIESEFCPGAFDTPRLNPPTEFAIE